MFRSKFSEIRLKIQIPFLIEEFSVADSLKESAMTTGAGQACSEGRLGIRLQFDADMLLRTGEIFKTERKNTLNASAKPRFSVSVLSGTVISCIFFSVAQNSIFFPRPE